jgi:hypothetical protein
VPAKEEDRHERSTQQAGLFGGNGRGVRRCVRLAQEALGGRSGGPDGPRPNFVLIISDDHGYGDYGWMGHPHIKTPNLDKMASEGMVFRHAHVSAPLCGPSVVTLLTGLYSHQHRKVHNFGGGAGEMVGRGPSRAGLQAVAGALKPDGEGSGPSKGSA